MYMFIDIHVYVYGYPCICLLISMYMFLFYSLQLWVLHKVYLRISATGKRFGNIKIKHFLNLEKPVGIGQRHLCMAGQLKLRLQFSDQTES